MGFIRGALVVVVSVLLFVMFLFGNIFLTLGNSLEYENIQTELVPVVEGLADSYGLTQVVDSGYEGFVLTCQNSSHIFVPNDFGPSINVSCESVAGGKESVSNELIDGVIYDIYYTSYDCGFFDCTSEGELPFYAVSEHSKKYFDSWFYKSLFAIILLFIFLFLLVEVKSNGFIISGAAMIVASIPFAKLDVVVSLFDFAEFLEIFGFLFTTSHSIFIRGLVLGIVLIAIGILWKFFSIGFKIQNLVERFKGKSKSGGSQKTASSVKKVTKAKGEPLKKEKNN